MKLVGAYSEYDIELLKEMAENCLNGKDYDDKKREDKYAALNKAIHLMEALNEEDEDGDEE